MAEGHTHHHAGKSPAAGNGDQNHQENVGNAHDQVNPPGDNGIHPTSKGGGKNPQDNGRSRTDQSRQQADSDAERKPRQGAGQHVPAHPVCAEGKQKAGRQILLREVRLHGPFFQENAGKRYRRQN